MKEKELHMIAPILSSISKELPFTVPDAYFDSVEDEVVATVSLDAFNLKNNKATSFNVPSDYFDTVETFVISKLKAEETLFEQENNVPEDYFDTIEDRVFESIKSDKKTTKIRVLTKYLAPIAIAASFLFIFILNSTKEPVTFDSLATTEIEQFIDYELMEIDTQTIVNTYADVDLDAKDISNTLSDEDVLDYLYDEDLDAVIYEN